MHSPAHWMTSTSSTIQQRNAWKNGNTSLMTRRRRLGDFNVKLSHDAETSGAIGEFKHVFCSHHLYPLINKPTREVKPSKSIIDKIYCNIPYVVSISYVGIIRKYINDHRAIFCLFNDVKSQD